MELVRSYLNRNRKLAVAKVPVPLSAIPITFHAEIYDVEAYALSMGVHINYGDSNLRQGGISLEVIFPDNQNFTRFYQKILMNKSFDMLTETNRYRNCFVQNYNVKMNGPSEAMSIELELTFSRADIR